jgi:hypothetical protein
MTKQAYRFSPSAIDELNKGKGADPQCLQSRYFALLMILVVLLLLLYLEIVW